MYLLVVCLLFAVTSELLAQGRLIPNPVRNVPRWVRTEFANRLDQQYDILYRLYPHTFTGDFNGDGRKDVAIQVQEKTSGKQGVAIFHGKKPQALSIPITVLGAGKAAGKAGENLKWATVWSFLKRRDANEQRQSSGLPAFTGDILKLEKRDSVGVLERGGVVYWDGSKYAWFPESSGKQTK